MSTELSIGTFCKIARFFAEHNDQDLLRFCAVVKNWIFLLVVGLPRFARDVFYKTRVLQ